MHGLEDVCSCQSCGNTTGEGGEQLLSQLVFSPFPDQDNTTRNWLLAFFCLILPMLLLLLFVYIKRNQIVSALLPLIQSLRE